MEEVKQLVELGKLAEAVQKVSESFDDPQGLSLAMHEVTHSAFRIFAVRSREARVEDFLKDLWQAVRQVNDAGKREVLEEAVVEYLLLTIALHRTFLESLLRRLGY